MIRKKKNLVCEICKDEPAVGVVCVPSVPYSAAYGQKCLDANAHPWFILVANTACIGGLDKAAEFWKEMVECTCKHLGKTIEEFNLAVAESVKTLDGYMDMEDPNPDDTIEITDKGRDALKQIGDE